MTGPRRRVAPRAAGEQPLRPRPILALDAEAPRNLDAFRRLTPLFQLQQVVAQGAYLTHRWERAPHRVNRYYLEDGGRGFFAEVGYEDALVELRVLRSFRSTVPLEDYLHGVQLPKP